MQVFPGVCLALDVGVIGLFELVRHCGIEDDGGKEQDEWNESELDI